MRPTTGHLADAPRPRTGRRTLALARLGTMLAAGLVLGTALASCKARVEDRPDAARLCATRCAQLYSTCYGGTDPMLLGHSSKDECTRTCTEDRAWEGPCRWKTASLLECTGALSCDGFHDHTSGPWWVSANSGSAPEPDPMVPCAIEAHENLICRAGGQQ